jgi:hypothetical protein
MIFDIVFRWFAFDVAFGFRLTLCWVLYLTLRLVWIDVRCLWFELLRTKRKLLG